MKWKIDEAEDLPLAVIEDTEDGMGIAEICPHKDQEANTRLIAAAPELLEALKGLLEVCHCTNDCDSNDMSCATNVALAAISKATS